MSLSAPIIARAQKKWQRKLQEGVILSHTTIHTHGSLQCIALIKLKDGTHVLGKIADTKNENGIGDSVAPRLTLQLVTDEGLRVYDVTYERVQRKETPIFEESIFPHYILAFTGPSGVGKSTVSTLLATLCSPYIERVLVLTTRKPKEGDDGEYHYVSKKAFADMKKGGELATWTDIPSASEKRSYGYRITDIEDAWKKGKIPVVVTEMHLLQGLAKHYGRRSILSFGLLPPGQSRRMMLSHLLFRLRKRGRETETQICERMKNAIADLAFFKERAELFDHFIVNEKLENVIEKLKPHIPGLKEA